jgi:excisionase family DNA binding protein
MIQRYITVQEAAQRLLVSECTLRRYIKQGLLQACKIRRKWLVDISEIEVALQNHKAVAI